LAKLFFSIQNWSSDFLEGMHLCMVVSYVLLPYLWQRKIDVKTNTLFIVMLWIYYTINEKFISMSTWVLKVMRRYICKV